MGQMFADARSLLQAAWRLDRRRMLLQIALMFITGFTGGFNLLLLIPVAANLTSTDASGLSIPGLGRLDLGGVPLPVLLLGMILLSLAQALLTRAASVNAAVMQQEIVDSIRQESFEALLAARWEFLLQRRRSDVIEIVTSGAARCGLSLQQMMQGFVTLVLALATAAVALWVQPGLAAISITGVLILGLALGTAVAPAHRLGRTFGALNRNLQATMTNSMDSLRLVRAHDAADVWRQDLADAFTGTRQTQLENTRRTATVSAASQVGLITAASALILVAQAMKVPGATILVILLLVARLARHAQSLVTTARQLAYSLPGVRDITDLTALARANAEIDPAQVPLSSSPDELDPTVPLVELRDVTFRYPQGAGVHDLSFRVERGLITALTGPSGAGKSTTADIILGLLQPSAGEVFVDGEELTPAKYRSWRSRISYVPQETVLIPDSLRTNLTWSVGRPVSDAECWEALDRAAADFARRLPDGLDTMLNDRGVRLSGGERQRVAIARALLRNPELLVMDEATSALDDETESAVIELMSGLAPKVTLLVIAHRKSTIERADRVVRLVEGTLAGETVAG